MTTDAEVKEYLSDVLTADSACEAATIVRRRRAFLRAGAEPARGARLSRDAARNRLVELAETLHDVDRDAFEDLFDGVDAQAHPDLAMWSVRLHDAIEARSGFRDAQLDPKIDPQVLAVLWALAISPERDAVQIRDRILAELDGPSLRDARDAARRLRRHHPKLYALEAEWFGRLERIEADRKLSDGDRISFSRRTILIAILALAVVAAFAVVLGRSP